MCAVELSYIHDVQNDEGKYQVQTDLLSRLQLSITNEKPLLLNLDENDFAVPYYTPHLQF